MILFRLCLLKKKGDLMSDIYKKMKEKRDVV